ncbi:Immunoglobulin heavy variable 1-69-2 [Bagarius yarrelli]|nr:Immunoglobulin heavy variable 1-69-2 [Bagarius yarrelli]
MGGSIMGLRVTQYYIFIIVLTKGVFSDEIRLDQSPAVVKRPGETVKISCKITGFDMTEYYMHWIRQKPGKALEWIGFADSTDEPTLADSMKGHFLLSEDVQSSTQFLEAKSLRTEDTAVYYCARQATLEWLGYLCSDDSTRLKDTMKSTMSFSQDESSNTVYLRGHNFQVEDTAVYFCARDTTVKTLRHPEQKHP